MTDAERKLWWHLREFPLQGSHFRRQATIGPYYADFACHQMRIVIEIDGGGHAQEQKMITDATRTEFLESQGYRVLRFWNNDVLTNVEGVLETIYDAVREERFKTPHP
jgi:very-short-patch-repair endonuclease